MSFSIRVGMSHGGRNSAAPNFKSFCFFFSKKKIFLMTLREGNDPRRIARPGIVPAFQFGAGGGAEAAAQGGVFDEAFDGLP